MTIHVQTCILSNYYDSQYEYMHIMYIISLYCCEQQYQQNDIKQKAN